MDDPAISLPFSISWQHSPMPAMLINEQGRVLGINPALEALLTPGIVFRQNIGLQVWWDFAQAQRVLAWARQALEVPQSCQPLLVRTASLTREMVWTEVLQSTDGVVVRGIAAPVSAQLRQLGFLKKAMMDLGKSISHDVVAPVRRQMMFSERLREMPPAQWQTDGKDFLHSVVQSGQDLANRFQALAELAKAEGTPMQLTPLRIDKLLEQVWTYFPGREAIVPGFPDMPPVLADFDYMQFIVRELWQNSLTCASPSRPLEIRVSAVQTDSGWRLLFQDNGIGIPSGRETSLFDFFYLIHLKEEVPGQGIGMGLTRARRLARLMGMDLEARSLPEGGAELALVIPAACLAET